MAQSKPLLDVAGLTISYRIGNTWLQAVHDFRLQLAARAYRRLGW